MVNQAEAPQPQAPPRTSSIEHRPEPSSPPAAIAACVRQLVGAPDDRAVVLVLDRNPTLIEPGLVALLLDRARIESSAGRQLAADHLEHIAGVVAGSSDPGVLEAVATLVASDQQIPAETEPTGPAPMSLLTPVRQAAAHLLSFGTGAQIRPSFWLRLYELLATVAARASTLTGDPYWVKLAVSASRLAIAACPDRSPDQPRLLNNLSIRLARHHQVLRDEGSLRSAVTCIRQAINLTPEGDANLASRLNNLSNRLYELFTVTGDQADLDEAILAGRQALAQVAGDPNSQLIGTNLDALLQLRAMMAPDTATDTATETGPPPGGPADRVAAARLTMAGASPEDASWADRVSELADALALAYRATSDPLALAESAQNAQAAVAATDPSSPAWPDRQSRLGARLTEQYRLAGNPDHLLAALTAYRHALGATPSGDTRLTLRLTNLAKRASELTAAGLQPHDLTLACQVARAAVGVTDEAHPDQQIRRSRLATLLVSSYCQRGAADRNALGEAQALVATLEPGGDALATFLAECRRQLAPTSAAPDITVDQEALARVAEVSQWLAQVTSNMTQTPPDLHPDELAPIPTPLPVQTDHIRPPIQSWIRAHSGPPRRSGDSTVTLLQIQIWLLFLIPAGLRIGVIGALGTPSLLWALLLFVIWLVTSAMPGEDACHPCRPLRWSLGLFWVAILISYGLLHRTAVASDEGQSADRYLISFVAFAGVALMTAEGLRTAEQVRRVIRTAVTAVSGMCLIAVLQSRLDFDVTRYMERIPGLSTYRPLDSVLTRSGFNRPAGTATHPIEFGVVVACTLALSAHLVVFDTGQSRYRRWATLGLISLGIPVAVSRSAILVASVVVIVFLVDSDRQRRIKALQVLAGLMLFVFLFVPGLLGTLRNYVFAGNSDSSISTRTSDYAAVAHYLRAQPWFGRGPGTFLPRLRILDNQYLMSLIEIGVVGMVSVLALFGLPIALGSGSRAKMTDPADRQLGRMLVSIGLGILLAASTFDAFSFPMFTMYVAFLLGIGGVQWNRANRGEGQPVTRSTS